MFDEKRKEKSCINSGLTVRCSKRDKQIGNSKGEKIVTGL